MSIIIETLIYILSISGIFLIFFTIADDNVGLIKGKKKEDKKVIDIYTYNIENEEVKIITSALEENEDLKSVVDIVNVYQRFDK